MFERTARDFAYRLISETYVYGMRTHGTVCVRCSFETHLRTLSVFMQRTCMHGAVGRGMGQADRQTDGRTDSLQLLLMLHFLAENNCTFGKYVI